MNLVVVLVLGTGVVGTRLSVFRVPSLSLLSHIADAESFEGTSKALIPDGVYRRIQQRIRVAEPEDETADEARDLAVGTEGVDGGDDKERHPTD